MLHLQVLFFTQYWKAQEQAQMLKRILCVCVCVRTHASWDFSCFDICIVHVSEVAYENTRACTRFVVHIGLNYVHPRVVMHLKDIGCEDGKCMEMAQNRVRRRATARVGVFLSVSMQGTQ